MKKKLKEEYQPGGSKRQEILSKAVRIHTGSKVWNPEHEARDFCWKRLDCQSLSTLPA